jgi:NADH dehydrogenase
MNNKIENDHNLKKYDWQKEHLPNQTGSENSYHPKKHNNVIKKKYKSWKS